MTYPWGRKGSDWICVSPSKFKDGCPRWHENPYGSNILSASRHFYSNLFAHLCQIKKSILFSFWLHFDTFQYGCPVLKDLQDCNLFDKLFLHSQKFHHVLCFMSIKTTEVIRYFRHLPLKFSAVEIWMICDPNTDHQGIYIESWIINLFLSWL